MNTGFALLKFLAPESILAETALIVLIAGLFKTVAQKRGVLLSLTLLGGLAAGVMLCYTPNATVSLGMVVLDPLTRLVKLAILVLSLITVIFAAVSNVRDHFAEYLGLILFSTIGMKSFGSAPPPPSICFASAAARSASGRNLATSARRASRAPCRR